MLSQLMPFLVLLIVGLIVSYIPTNPTLKNIAYIILGVALIVLLIKFLHL